MVLNAKTFKWDGIGSDGFMDGPLNASLVTGIKEHCSESVMLIIVGSVVCVVKYIDKHTCYLSFLVRHHTFWPAKSTPKSA